MTSCAETIKKIRAKLKLDQRAFAEKLNLSKTAIYNYEAGLRKPKRIVAFNIQEFAKSQGIKVSLDDLLA